MVMATGRTMRQERSRRRGKELAGLQQLRKTFGTAEAAERWVTSCVEDGWRRVGVFEACHGATEYTAVVERPRPVAPAAVLKQAMATFETFEDAVAWSDVMKGEGYSASSIRWNGVAYLVVMSA